MTRETITLTQEEQRRAVVLTAIGDGRVTAAEGTSLLSLSLRHCRRLLARVRRDGPAGLAHGNRGRRPPNRVPARLEQRIVRLARTVYAGFNHQHLTEHLADEQGITLSRPTVHRILVAHGLPSPRPRRRRRFRRRRERMPQAGLLVQCDASHHDWLEGRGPHLVLHSAIDDATSQVPAAVFREEEDAQGYFLVLRDLVGTQGCPVALYTDRHGVFHKTSRADPSLAQQLRGLRRPPTQFGRALADLGIRWIPAASPQAKGRIERLWGTF
jgi:transposase